MEIASIVIARKAPGVISAPPPSAALTIADIPQNRMSYPPAGTGLAAIPLSGTATPGAAIEARDYSTPSPTAWVEIGMAGGSGLWSGTVAAAPQGYFRPEVRLRDNPAVTAEMTTELGVGPVWMFESQSIIDNGLTTFADQLPVKIDPADARLLVMQEYAHNAPNTETVFEISPAQRLTSPVAAFSNTLAEAGPAGMVYTVLFATKSGTVQRALADDDQGSRIWAEAAAMVDLVEACGSHVSALGIMHYNGDANSVNILTPFWGKALRDGTDIALGSGVDFDAFWNASVEPRGGAGGSFGSSRGFNLDHCLFDLAAPAGQKGSGLLRKGETAFRFITQTDPAAGAMRSQTHTTAGSVDFEMQNYQLLTEGVAALFADPAWAALGGEIIGSTAFAYGDPDGSGGLGDSIHPRKAHEDGAATLWRQLALLMLRADGAAGVPAAPEISSVVWAADGAKATVTFDGPISTMRYEEAGRTGDAGAIGFELMQVAGGGAADWRSFTHAATVTDVAGGVVEIVPAAPFANGHRLRFGHAGAQARETWPADELASDFKRFPVAPLSGVSGLTGLPARAVSVETWEAAGIAAAGPALFHTAGEGPCFINPDPTPAGVSRMMFEARAHSTGSGFGYRWFGLVHPNLFRVGVNQSNRAMKLEARTTSNAVLLDQALPAGTLPAGMTTVMFALDLPAQKLWLYLDGVEHGEYALAAGMTQFPSTTVHVIKLMDNTSNLNFVGEVERLKVWTDFTLSGGKPVVPADAAALKIVAGAPAAVNADPWKIGADAV